MVERVHIVTQFVEFYIKPNELGNYDPLIRNRS
jgi:hypothetical protein